MAVVLSQCKSLSPAFSQIPSSRAAHILHSLIHLATTHILDLNLVHIVNRSSLRYNGPLSEGDGKPTFVKIEEKVANCYYIINATQGNSQSSRNKQANTPNK